MPLLSDIDSPILWHLPMEWSDPVAIASAIAQIMTLAFIIVLQGCQCRIHLPIEITVIQAFRPVILRYSDPSSYRNYISLILQ